MLPLDAYKERYCLINNNCWHFVVKYTKAVFNIDVNVSRRKDWISVAAPADGDLVILHKNIGGAHVGFIYRGQLCHLTPAGTRCDNLADVIGYYRSCKIYRLNNMGA